MTRQQHLARLTRGIGEDMRDYRVLHQLLEQQFEAALHYQATQLGELATHITALVATLVARREERVATVQSLLGPDGTMAAAFALLAAAPRASLEQGWHALESLVRECKQLNERNCRLLMDQNSIMQRVLHGEEETYVPA